MTNPSDFANQLADGVEPEDLQTFDSGLIATPGDGVLMRFVCPRDMNLRAIRSNAGNYGTSGGPTTWQVTVDGLALAEDIVLSAANTDVDDSTLTRSGGQQAIAEGALVEVVQASGATGLADLALSVELQRP